MDTTTTTLTVLMANATAGALPNSNTTSSSALAAWLTWSFSPNISAILVTLLIGLTLPLLIHTYLYRKSRAIHLPTFLLLGPSGAGKTSLLTLLSNTTPSSTHTSQTPHTALCDLSTSTISSADKYRSAGDPSAHQPRQFHLIDTPGHGKLRHHALSSLTPPSSSLKSLIFLLDSAALSSPSGLSEAAEYLHDVLLLLQKRHTSATSSKAPAPIAVMIAANKQDVFTSLPPALVGKKLEAEVGRVRGTRSKAMRGVESEGGVGDDAEEEWVGEFGTKEFFFKQMAEWEVDVTVVGGSVKGEDGEGARVEKWWQWIGERM